MPVQKKPRPKSEAEAINENIHPYPLLDRGNPNMRSNRGEDVSVRGDEFKDISIELEDVYAAIVNYIRDRIQPTVVENGQQIPVPVEFAFGDRWNEVQKNGFLRDKEGRVLLPLIVLRRDNIVRNRSIGNKLDGNKVHLYQSFETRYTQKNQYDNFAVLTNRIPVKQYHLAPVPDYVTITYNASILANSQKHSDQIIQAFNFAENSYWGEANRFKFSAVIDSFTDTIEYTQGEDRSVRCNFNIVVNAYLLPDSVNRSLASQKKVLSKATLKFNMYIDEISLSSMIGTVPEVITNDFLIANGIYIVNSNGLRINIGPQEIITEELLFSLGAYLINSNGLRINLGPQTITDNFLTSNGTYWINSNGNRIET